MARDRNPSCPGDDRTNDLSEEDLALEQQLELYVKRVQDADPGVQKLALMSIWHEIRTPKPLKFLRTHYGNLKAHFETMADSELKKYLADIISVLAMTMSADKEMDSLKYKLLGSEGDIGSWGDAYVRNLTGQIHEEIALRQCCDMPKLMELVQQILAYYMKHNAEPEAVDLSIEVEDLDLLVDHADSTNYRRACSYLTSCLRG